MPHERAASIGAARQFLWSLLDPKQTPRIPRALRQQAYRCLRHYPMDLDIERAAELAPDVFGPSPYKHPNTPV